MLRDLFLKGVWADARRRLHRLVLRRRVRHVKARRCVEKTRLAAARPAQAFSRAWVPDEDKKGGTQFKHAVYGTI